MKNRILILVVLIIGLGNLAKAQKNFIDQPFVEVKGHGEMEVVPNEIYLNIFLNEEDTKNRETVDVIERQMVKALKKAGVDVSKQLSVADFSGSLRRKFLRKRNVEQTKNFQLVVYDVKTLNKVFLELDKVHISDINITRVDHSDMENYRLKVRAMAAKNGKKKADAMINALGQSLGKAIFINELSSYRNNYRGMPVMMELKSSAGANSIPRLDFKKIKIECDLQMRFAL